MTRVCTTPQADQDLVEIALYTATSQGRMDTARAFVWMLQDTFDLLARTPELGRLRDDIPGLRIEGERLRSFPVNKYLVLYQPTEDGVRIFRVLHSSRDIPALF
jgi:toxin ParE1/3/4